MSKNILSEVGNFFVKIEQDIVKGISTGEKVISNIEPKVLSALTSIEAEVAQVIANPASIAGDIAAAEAIIADIVALKKEL